MIHKKRIVLTFSPDLRQRQKVDEVMQQFQINKSAAARMIFDKALDADLTLAVSREALRTHYNMVSECFTHLTTWIRSECDRLNGNLQEIEKIPHTLADILGTPKHNLNGSK